MTKKSFIIILVLSVMVTYGVAFADAIMRNSLLAGEVGFPLKFSSASFFSDESLNYTNLILDVLIWFFIIWVLLWGFKKLANK